MHDGDGPHSEVEVLLRSARRACGPLARSSAEQRDAALRAVAEALRGPARDAVLEANALDVADARRAGASAALLDRLRLDGVRLDALAEAVETVAGLPDPVGRLHDRRTLPNGLEVARMNVPLGLVALVYESRPNVTVDAAALCLKSGNAVVLRGGREAARSNAVLASLFGGPLRQAGLPESAVCHLPPGDRSEIVALCRAVGLVDLLVPRGGPELVERVVAEARVPVLQHARGVCHVYVDGDADLAMAERIALNAKVQRPGVCNAMETLLVDRACAPAFVPRIIRAMRAAGVEVRGDASVQALVPDVVPATEADFDTEHLALVLSMAVVEGLEGALAHIARHGTRHTEAIVTSDPEKGRRFVREVDASLVLVNASTRFNDGGQLGLGAELGISTTKLHAYGPMGLEELCARKWVAFGSGQVRA